ncbi:MAG: isochorismatase family cysteine hydrolase [Candidatus Dormiibacterota bacterium]
MKVPSQRIALLAIDLQNGFCRPGGTFERSGVDVSVVAPAVVECSRLVAAARSAGVPVIFTKAWFQPDGSDAGFSVSEVMRRASTRDLVARDTWDAAIIDGLGPVSKDHVMTKIRFSPFGGSAIDPLLTALRIENLVICGLTTSICVESTVRDAASRDYRVFVPTDAVAEYSPEMHRASLAVIEYGFGFLTTSDDVISAWRTE